MKTFLHSENFVGSWTGVSRLWYPADKSHDSASTAEIVVPANDACLSIAYTWAHEGKPQEGALMLDCDSDTHAIGAAWMDTWHQPDGALQSQGTIDTDGKIDVLGSFSAGEGPDWGWRTTIQSDGATLTLKMYCIEPEGDEEVAVAAEYTRTK